MALKSDLLWALCRRHEWTSDGISGEALVDLALPASDQGKGHRVVEELRAEPYVTYQKGNGYSIKNDPDSHAQAAYRLRHETDRTDLQIVTTLSRFKQAGGWDAYDEDEVLESLPDW